MNHIHFLSFRIIPYLACRHIRSNHDDPGKWRRFCTGLMHIPLCLVHIALPRILGHSRI